MIERGDNLPDITDKPCKHVADGYRCKGYLEIVTDHYDYPFYQCPLCNSTYNIAEFMQHD